jgi:glutamate-1-semialdehyde 2,1-aminomutase
MDRLDRQGEWLRSQLDELFADHRMPGQATGLGSLFNVHFTDGELTDYRSVRRSSPALAHRFLLGMLNHGVLLAARGLGALSTPMDQPELRAFLDAADRTLAELHGGVAT